MEDIEISRQLKRIGKIVFARPHIKTSPRRWLNEGLMFTTISVGWDGMLYDCDFNQILGLNLDSEYPRHIADFNYSRLSQRKIIVRDHCYCCTAGLGST
jgi:hypothetical protein